MLEHVVSLLTVEHHYAGHDQRTQGRERLAVVLILAFVASIGGAFWWYRHTSTPEYSLSQLGQAVREKNYGKASQ
jgi:hypothetical protein